MGIPGLLIVVTGAPGAGKTTLARRIAGEFALPCFSKDSVKEVMLDHLGWSDAAWSRRVGVASLALLFTIAEAELASGRSLILESNFRPAFDTARFRALRQRVAYRPFQIVCDAAPDVLIERFRRRWEAGERHPGFVENEQIETFAATHLTGAYHPLSIGGEVHMLDTSDVDHLDLALLLGSVQTALSSAVEGATHG